MKLIGRIIRNNKSSVKQIYKRCDTDMQKYLSLFFTCDRVLQESNFISSIFKHARPSFHVSLEYPSYIVEFVNGNPSEWKFPLTLQAPKCAEYPLQRKLSVQAQPRSVFFPTNLRFKSKTL